MTFYSYGLNEERASALALTLTLSATSGETASQSFHVNGHVLPLAATDGQSVSAAGKTVGKILLWASAESAHLATTSFHSFFKTLTVASAQASSSARQHLGVLLLQATSSEATGLVLAKPFHSVVAAQQANTRRLIRAVSRSYSLSQLNVPVLLRAASHFSSFSVTSAEAAHSIRGSAVVKSAVNASSAALLWGWGRPFLAVNASVATRLSAVSKILAAVDAEIATLNRTLPQHASATSPDAAHLSFGGGNLFQRVFGAVSAESLLLARGMVTQRGAVDSNAAGLSRVLGKPMGSVSSGSLSSLSKSALRLLGAVSASAVGVTRQISLPRGVLSGSVAFSQEAVARLGAALHAVQAQVAAAFEQHARPAVLSATQSQAASSVRNALRTLLVMLAATQNQVAAVGRFMSKALTLFSPEAAALARTAFYQRLFAAGSSNLAGLVRLTGKAFAALSGSVAATRASYGRLFHASSTELATLIAHHGSFLGVLSPDIATVQKTLAKIIGITSSQAISLANFIAKSLALISGEIVAAAKGMYRFPSTTSTEMAKLMPRRGSNFVGAASASVAALQKLTGKILPVIAAQIAASGRIDFKRLGATTTNVASLLKPRGFALHAVQTQVARVVDWFHLFVPDWASQQTILLPPGGGQAEPPSFGPFDPQDMTTFAFNWSARADPNDPIVSATVASVPPGLLFAPSPVFISGTLVQVTVMPSPQAQLPATYRLRCTCVFASGRRSSFSIPVPVRTL